MRAPVPLAVAAMVMAFTACSPAPQPQTVVAPDGGLSGLQTFQVVDASNFLGDVQPGETRPPFVNSTTSRALGATITTQLERRGYTPSEAAPDVLVKYGVAAKEDLDPSDGNYDYLWRTADWRDWGPGQNDATPEEYAEGAVVIDVIDTHTGQLLWRGHAPADPSGDENVAVRRLDRTVTSILGRFPERTVALGPAADSSRASRSGHRAIQG